MVSHCILAELPIKDFVKVFWRTWVVILGPFLLSPMILLSGEDPQTREAMKVDIFYKQT